jgi:hypothetical protein
LVGRLVEGSSLVGMLVEGSSLVGLLIEGRSLVGQLVEESSFVGRFGRGKLISHSVQVREAHRSDYSSDGSSLVIVLR